MVWQSFWTRNPQLLKTALVQRVAEGVLGNGDRKEEALNLLVLVLGRGWWEGGGVAILYGATREAAMKSDLEAAVRVGAASIGERMEFSRLVGEDD